jgi:hypothetical protein
MIQKPLKGGGFHFLCYGRDPVEHRVTIFWKRPQDAPTEAGAEVSPECDRARDSAPANTQVSSRASSLLARAEKLTQGRVGK